MTISTDDRPDPRQVTALLKPPDVPTFASPRLPEIDYDHHPAYGVVLPAPALADRIRAIRIYLPNLVFVIIKWLVDYEHLPLLTKERNRGKPPTFLSIALPFIGMVARVRIQRILKTVVGGRRVRRPSAQEPLHTLQQDGIVGLRLAPDELTSLQQALAPAFKTLERRRQADLSGGRDFEDSRLWLMRADAPKVYGLIENLLTRHGILEAASVYLRRPVRVKHVNPQINDSSDDFWRDQFGDIGLANPQTTYMHFDASYGCLKCMVYLSEVTDETGPFSYVRGSNRARVGLWEGWVRRANDYAGLSSPERRRRELFMALPRMFRKKCAFGADIIDRSVESDELLRSEIKITSNMGDLVLFDPIGIHRGGMVTRGERRAVTLLLAET